jgi:hypothetical protein
MKLILACLALAAIVQDDKEQKKKAIIEKISKQLEGARKDVLDRVTKIIDEELGKTAPASGLADRVAALEKRLRTVREEMDKLRPQILEAKKMAADEKLYDQSRKTDLEPADAQSTFQEGMTHHNAKEFPEAIAKFKTIFYYFHDKDTSGIGRIMCASAYNVACGYALAGNKEEALDWLEISIHRGFLAADGKLEHMETDTDLDALREESRYKEFVRRAKAK